VVLLSKADLSSPAASNMYRRSVRSRPSPLPLPAPSAR
jgi:hypothetical protein